MKRLLTICVVLMMLLITCVGQANVVTLKFNANDIFNYATSDDSRLNQQGTARLLWDCPTDREYLTYNDGTREIDATPEQDLQSVANILSWTAFAGYQGASHLQLWLNNGANVRDWGEVIVVKSGTLTAFTDEYDWTTNVSGDIAHFNTELGGEGHQNAISPDFNPADNLWSVTGDFYVDVDEDGSYTEGTDEDLVLGQEYTIWFNAPLNNWRCVDAYGNDLWEYPFPDIEGTIIATAVAADAINVEIDIKPGSYPNVVNLGSNGVLPIAILSSETFDATTVDPATVTLKGSDVAVRGKNEKALAHEEDVNGDGRLDLVCKVETENLYPGAGYAILTGSTYGGQAIVGQDEIIIVPPE